MSSAALYLPAGAPRAVVSWAHGANGLGDQCAPTVRGRPDRESRYFRSLLAAGLAVVATDYIGLGTPGPSGFLDSVGEANAVADAARATRHLQPSVDSWIADGHSQGAHATFNAAAHGPGHAPELRYLGAAATSFPPQVDALIPLMTPTTPPLPLELTGLYLMALRGFSAIHPDLHVEDHLSTLGKRLFRTNDTKCIDAINDAARGVPISATLRTPLSASTIEAFQRYLRLPVRGIDRPLFLGAGLRDQTLPYPAVLPAVAALRANGVDARFHTYDAGHDDIIEISLRDRLSFVTGLAR